MRKYVLSRNPTSWNVHRYSDNVVSIASGLAREEDALAIALQKAEEDRPSQVVAINLAGVSRIIATFEDEADDNLKQEPEFAIP